MELQLNMLSKFTDEEISLMTGITIRTIKDWREMMRELDGAEIRTRPFIRTSPEKEIQTRFAKTLNCQYQEYVRTKYGIIDILTDSSLYEVKVDITNATIQKPVGQVILYSTELQDRKKIIVARSIKISSYIEKAISALGIQLVEFSM